MTCKITKLGYVFLAISILTISLYMKTSSISPMNGEDYALTRIFENESFLSRLTWIAERSQQQMSEWNARLGEQLAIFWLSMPEIYFLITMAKNGSIFLENRKCRIFSTNSIVSYMHLFL